MIAYGFRRKPEGDVIAHIDLGLDEHRHPGIRGLNRFRPETAGPLNALAETLLRAPHPTLSPGERELIAAYVSGLNDCEFCSASHSATAAAQLPAGMPLVEQVRADLDAAPIDPKLRALLRIAAAVRRSGRDVTPELVEAARAAGATDLELHDVVLIAAAFCMYNRYVDGLAAFTPDDPRAYEMGARHLVEHGYAAG
ncbi:carboxymuconolactone decarboxylase family protein [Micromonospora coerulea]|uniref:Carboxymuconolactone decarboxylase family protein n=1 Tax=Micromonospora coerulea TaxID=47856 RepID=A0ABP8SHG2_9ACTN